MRARNISLSSLVSLLLLSDNCFRLDNSLNVVLEKSFIFYFLFHWYFVSKKEGGREKKSKSKVTALHTRTFYTFPLLFLYDFFLLYVVSLPNKLGEGEVKIKIENLMERFLGISLIENSI